MGKLNFRALVMMIFTSSLLLAQNQKVDEVDRVIAKMESLGKQDPAGKDPYHKLSAEEKQVFDQYSKNRSLNELKINKTSVDNSSKMLITKAYGVDVRNFDFAWVPLSPPLTENVLGPLTGNYYCDDVAANGNVYAVNNDTKNLVIFSNIGTPTIIGPLGIPAAQTIAGMSFNWVTSTMYLISHEGTTGTYTHRLYTVNLQTGATTLLGTFGAATQVPIWLEIDNNGNAFYADITSDNLFSLNLNTRATSQIGAFGINLSFAQDADFNRETNVLYMAAYVGASVGQGRLATVDTTTGLATVIGNWVPATAGDIVEFSTFSVTNDISATFLAAEEVNIDKTGIYPNPTTGIINIDLKGRDKAEIFNAEGRLVRSAKLKSGSNQIDITEFQNGVYWLRTTEKGKGETTKIIKR